MPIPDVAAAFAEVPRLTIARMSADSLWHIRDEAGAFTAVAANPLRVGSRRPNRSRVEFTSAQGVPWLTAWVSGVRRWAVARPDGSRRGLVIYPFRTSLRRTPHEFEMWDGNGDPAGCVLRGRPGHGIVMDRSGVEVGVVTRHRNHAAIELKIRFGVPVRRELVVLCIAAEIGRTSAVPVVRG